VAELVDNATGQVVEVDHDTAIQALQQGSHGLRADKPVNLVAADGSIVNADAKDVGALLAPEAGYRLAGQEEVAKDLERQQYGEGFGNEAAAFGEGALSGATMGISDVAARAIDDDYATDLARRREYNPISAGIGEATGVIGSALLSGGAGAAGTLTKALPASLAMRGAEALAGKTAAMGVKALGQTAIQGALEGALFGASKAVTDDYLNDHEITAERIALGAGLGGLTGGLFGAGGHALAAGLGKAGDLKEKIVSGVMGRIGGAGDDGVRAGIPRFLEGSTAARQFDDTLEASAAKVKDSWSGLAETTDMAQAYSRGGFKKGALEKLMGQDPPPNLRNTVETVAEDLQSAVDHFSNLASDVGGFDTGGRRSFKAVLKDIEEVTKDLPAPRNPTEAADFYRRLDKLKTRIGGERSSLERAGQMGSKDSADASVHLNNFYDTLKARLEDANLWGGKATDLQREVNSKITGWLQYARAADDHIALPWNRRTDVSVRDAFVKPAFADPAKAVSLMQKAGSYANSEAERTLVEGAARQADLLETLAQHYDLPPELLAKVKGARGHADEIASTVGEMSRLGKLRDDFANSMATTADIPLIGGALVKGAKSLGAAVRTSGLLSREATAAGQVANEVARSEVVHRAAVRAADRAEREIETTASKVVERIVKSKTSRSIADAASVLGYDFSAGTAGSVSGLSEHLADFLGDGDSRKKVRAKLWDVRQVSPEMADAMEAQALKSAQFLAEKAAAAVPPKSPTDVYGHLRKKTQDPAQAQRLGNYVEAVASPQKAIARIRDGEGRKEDMETLKALYPKMAQRLTAAILQKVTESKKIPSMEAQQAISQLTGIPVGRGSDPRYTAQLQALIKESPTSSAMQQDRPPRRSSGTPKVASMYGSPSDTRESIQ